MQYAKYKCENDGITVEVTATTRACLQTTCVLDRRTDSDLVQKSPRFVRTRNSIALFTRTHSLSHSRQFVPFYNVSHCSFNKHLILSYPIPVVARSKVWVCSRSLVSIAGLNPASGMDVSWECCVFSGRDLCDGPITHSEQSY